MPASSFKTEYLCKRCNTLVPMSEVRYSKTGRDLICIKCAEMQKQVFGRKAPKQEEIKSVEAVSKLASMQKRQSSVKARYRCLTCGFRFARDKKAGYTPSCPYCGKDSINEETPQSAEQLLKDSDY